MKVTLSYSVFINLHYIKYKYFKSYVLCEWEDGEITIFKMVILGGEPQYFTKFWERQWERIL